MKRQTLTTILRGCAVLLGIFVFAFVFNIGGLRVAIVGTRMPDPPEAGAVLKQVLLPESDETFQIGEYRYKNDGLATDMIMVVGTWVHGNSPDDFLVFSGKYVEKGGYLLQNLNGALYIWQKAGADTLSTYPSCAQCHE